MRGDEMYIEKILNLIEHALASAPGSFEATANGPVEDVNWGADRMPESWITSVLMQAAHKQDLAAFPEVRIKHDIEVFESDGQKLNPNDFQDLTGAKIDLFIGDRSLLPGCVHLRVVLEIKGPKSNWQQFHNDIKRLRQIKQVVCGKNQAVLFAYLTCPLLDVERVKEDQKLEEATGLKVSDFKVLPAAINSRATDTDGVRRSFVYMYVVR